MNEVIVAAWAGLMALSFMISTIASPPPNRSIDWLSEFLIKWGLASVLLWVVALGFWGAREVLAQKYIALMGPVEGYAEHASIWGAVLTGGAAFTMLGVGLLTRVIFDLDEAPGELVYYRQEVVVANPDAVREEKAVAR